jgi:ribonuclease BN (tRNA processing enzyme)
VSRLLLTHIWPLYDETVLLKECQDVFQKSEIAVEGKEYTVLVP